MEYNKDVEKAAKMAASNQSLTITKDEGAIAEAKLKEEQRQFQINTQLKEQELAISAAKNAESSNNKEGKETVDADGNVILTYENVTPTITPGQSNNLIVDAVTGFQKMNSELYNSGVNSMIEVLQSTTSGIFKDMLTAQEASALAKAYKQSEYTPAYTTIVGKIKQGLINKGASKKEIDKINGPVQLILKLEEYYVGEVDKDLAQKEINIKNNTPDPALDSRIINEYGDYTIFQTAKSKMDNAFAHNRDFNRVVSERIKSNPKFYEKISIVKKDGTAELITAQGLVDNYPLEQTDANGKKTKTKYPIGLMQSYINGNLDWKFDAKKTEANKEAKYEKELDNQGFLTELFFGKKIKKDDSKTNDNFYYALDPNTGVKYDITEIITDYGLPKVLAANLQKTFTTDKSLLPNDLAKTILDRTGEMGRTLTWTSSTKSEKDHADKLANDIGQNLNSYMIQTGGAFNIITADTDLAESLNSGVISQIKSTPIKGLTAVKYNPIGSRDPSKRNITLVYDQEMLLGANAKDYKGWDGNITFEVRSDAVIPGLPTAEGGSYYDLQLSVNPKGITQTSVDEQVGLKYEVYKDQDGKIKFKVGYQTILETVDNKGAKVLSYIWKDGTDPSGSTAYSETGGFKFLPTHKTIEETIDELRQLAITVRQQTDTKLQKAYPNVAPVPIADQTFIDEATKTISDISKKYNK
jgi:hypothetical protein